MRHGGHLDGKTRPRVVSTKFSRRQVDPLAARPWYPTLCPDDSPRAAHSSRSSEFPWRDPPSPRLTAGLSSGKSLVGFDAFHPLGNFSGFERDAQRRGRAGHRGPQEAHQGHASPCRSPACAPGRPGGTRIIRRALDGEHHPEIRYRIEKVESSFQSLTENTDVLLTIHGVSVHAGRRAARELLGARSPSAGRPLGPGRESPPSGRLRRPSAAAPGWSSMKEYVLATFDLTLEQGQLNPRSSAPFQARPSKLSERGPRR